MEVHFNRNLKHNFMVLSEVNNNRMESYCIKMLAYQQIEGILPLEIQTINNQAFFNYEITAKQSVYNLFDKTILSFDRVRKMFVNLIDTIERSYDYLLLPDDFIVTPEYVYLDINTDMPYLCYLPGHQKNIKEQLSSFIEYMMNKVDYNDKEAVLLIYRLYAISKEEGYTFNHLKETIQNSNSADPARNSVNSKVINNHFDFIGEELQDKNQNNDKCYLNVNTIDETREEPECNPKSQSASTFFNMPVMMEKVVGEQEVSCYPVKTYLFSVASILGGILLLLFCSMTNVIYNSFGNRIDYSKLFALLLILIGLEGYLMKIIWDKKNRITKMVSKSEYIDPRGNLDIKKENEKQQKDDQKHSMSYDDSVLPSGECGLIDKNQQDKWISCQEGPEEINPFKTIDRNKEGKAEEEAADREEEYNPTCLLNEIQVVPTYTLDPVDKESYETIPIKEIPFYIGKIKKNVDYCLEKDVVSRYHAKISEEQDQFYITDLNSTNGTFLNGEVLQPYSSKEIKVGDEITLADIKFIFATKVQGLYAK